MSSFETYEIYTNGQELEIVETVPGWAHDITNIGDEEMVNVVQMKYLIKRNQILSQALVGARICTVKFPDKLKVMKMKLMPVVGTRPEIIRLSRVIAKLDHYCEHILVTQVRIMTMNLTRFFLMT